MFSITYAIRITAEKVVEVALNRKFRTLNEAIKEAKGNQLAEAYRIFDKEGYRVYSEKR